MLSKFIARMLSKSIFTRLLDPDSKNTALRAEARSAGRCASHTQTRAQLPSHHAAGPLPDRRNGHTPARALSALGRGLLGAPSRFLRHRTGHRVCEPH